MARTVYLLGGPMDRHAVDVRDGIFHFAALEQVPQPWRADGGPLQAEDVACRQTVYTLRQLQLCEGVRVWFGTPSGDPTPPEHRIAAYVLAALAASVVSD